MRGAGQDGTQLFDEVSSMLDFDFKTEMQISNFR